MNLKENGSSTQNFKLAELFEVIVEGGHAANFQPLHHDERNRVAERIRFVTVLSKQADCSLMIFTGNFCQMHQPVLPKILNDLLANCFRPGEGRVNFREHECRRSVLSNQGWPGSPRACDSSPRGVRGEPIGRDPPAR